MAVIYQILMSYSVTPIFMQICLSRNIIHNWTETGAAISAITISYSNSYGAIK